MQTLRNVSLASLSILNFALGAVNSFAQTNIPPSHPYVSIYSPTNNSKFLAPANISIYVRSYNSPAVVQTVEFFVNNSSLGVVSNSSQVVITNISPQPLFPLTWSNVLTGSYALKAVATNSFGISSTSAIVNVSVVTNLSSPPPSPLRPYIVSPTNNSKFLAPAYIPINVRVETNATVTVRAVQLFAGTTSLGIVTNGSPSVSNINNLLVFPLTWSNVVVGSYALKAVQTDSHGLNSTSAVVNISVVTNVAPPPPHPYVYILSPTNGAKFLAPADIPIYARALESTGIVQTVELFANNISLGVVSNGNQVIVSNISVFPLIWSNVQVGSYGLKALATDLNGLSATSAVVTVSVLTNLSSSPPTNTIVRIYAPDPVAIEGTNCGCWYNPGTSFTNYCGGTNTATFLIQRDGRTNAPLTVYYRIGGSASNGVDYATINDNVTIPSGRPYALITIAPLDDEDPAYRRYDTVILSLVVPTAPTNTPPPYAVGSPGRAAAVILEENFLPITGPFARCVDNSSLHVSLPATNGMNFCLQVSSNLIDWVPLITNTVIKGSAQYVAPDVTDQAHLFYRLIPASGPPEY